MSNNRRGFIGIFSQSQDQDDSREVEEDPDGPEQDAKKSLEPNDGEVEVASEGAMDSDWNDIFDENSRRDYSSPELPTVNPVAAAMASKSPHESTEMSSSAEAKESKPNPIPTVNETSGTQTADENTNETSKTMHNGPSSKSILSKSDRQVVADAIQTLREKLSFAREAGGDQRDGLMKLGATGREFINQATKVVGENPDVLPRSFDDESFVNDAELVEMLRNIGADLRDLTQRVADTESKIASSAFAGALLIHRSGGVEADKANADVYRKTTGAPANGSAQANRDHSSMSRVGG